MQTGNYIKLGAFILFLGVLQILVLSPVGLSLHNSIYPQVYILGFLLFPTNTKSWLAISVAFLFGIIIGLFSNSSGIHAFSLTALMFLRYIYFNNYMDKNKLELNEMPTYQIMDSGFYLAYISLSSLVFHTLFFTLTYFSLKHIGTVIESVILSTSVSILFMLILQFMFNPKQEEDA